MNKDEVINIINKHFTGVDNIEEVCVGKIKEVYFFNTKDKSYVISFYTDDNIKNDEILSSILGNDSDITNRVIFKDVYKDKIYTISNKIEGDFFDRNDIDTFIEHMPKVFECITKVHMADVGNQKGFGWIENGHGMFSSMEHFVTTMFEEDCNGYWENWFDLFDTTFLDIDEFFNLYNEIFNLLKFCKTRHLVHGDFFLNNMLLSPEKTVHLIDWDNAMICDFLYDVAALDCELPHLDIKGKFKDFYINRGIDIPNYDKRFKCMSLIKGLDGLRFFAKTNDEKSYNSVLQYLKNL